jgi:hypothetical protein
MIMNTRMNFRNFFLTADHCAVTANNDHTVVVYWNYESPVCGWLSGGSLAQNQRGATLRASKGDVDVCLIELDDDPDPEFNVYYAGWDRSGIPPAGSVGIHHPNGDEKAISYNDDALTTIDSCIGAGSDTHWEVDDWENGTTEPGSSGSGLWDPDTHLLVGTLSGGSASCTVPWGEDCYGKFSVAWDSGATPTTRLKDWLDPENTGAVSVPGSYPVAIADIRANGTSGRLTISQAENLAVTVSLDPRTLAGTNADWWALVKIPSGAWYHYDKGADDWQPGKEVTHQGPLSAISSVKILDRSGLPVGTYAFHFGVDLVVNGSVDAAEAYRDRVRVIIEP